MADAAGLWPSVSRAPVSLAGTVTRGALLRRARARRRWGSTTERRQQEEK